MRLRHLVLLDPLPLVAAWLITDSISVPRVLADGTGRWHGFLATLLAGSDACEATSTEFRRHLRVTPDLFREIVDKVRPEIEYRCGQHCAAPRCISQQASPVAFHRALPPSRGPTISPPYPGCSVALACRFVNVRNAMFVVVLKVLSH